MNYYWFHRQEILQKAKEQYSKEKAAEYYKQNKEAIKEKPKERYKNLSLEEKDKIKEYQKKKKKKKIKNWLNIKKIIFVFFLMYINEIVKPLCIILPQMSGYIEYFENGNKNMSFFIKDDEVRDKYDKICNVIKDKLNIKFHSEPVYEYKYLKAKVREFDAVIKTNFLNNGIPKENMYYSCIACITIDSVMNFNEKKLSTSLFRRV